MTTIAIRQETAAGTQGAGYGFLQKVKGFFGRVALEASPYVGPLSVDRGSLLNKEQFAVDPDVINLMRM